MCAVRGHLIFKVEEKGTVVPFSSFEYNNFLKLISECPSPPHQHRLFTERVRCACVDNTPIWPTHTHTHTFQSSVDVGGKRYCWKNRIPARSKSFRVIEYGVFRLKLHAKVWTLELCLGGRSWEMQYREICNHHCNHTRRDGPELWWKLELPRLRLRSLPTTGSEK